MITDISGIELTPANFREDCKGNGKHYDENGKPIECCCDECNYLLCCTSETPDCINCMDYSCPRIHQIKSF